MKEDKNYIRGKTVWDKTRKLKKKNTGEAKEKYYKWK